MEAKYENQESNIFGSEEAVGREDAGVTAGAAGSRASVSDGSRANGEKAGYANGGKRGNFASDRPAGLPAADANVTEGDAASDLNGDMASVNAGRGAIGEKERYANGDTGSGQALDGKESGGFDYFDNPDFDDGYRREILDSLTEVERDSLSGWVSPETASDMKRLLQEGDRRELLEIENAEDPDWREVLTQRRELRLDRLAFEEEQAELERAFARLREEARLS